MTVSNVRSNGALIAIAVLITLGCKNTAAQSGRSAAGGPASAANLSGPPSLNVLFGARNPRVCTRLTTPPNAAEAVALIQCHMDQQTREDMYLMQNIHIQMDGSRPFANDGIEDNIDNSAPVYDFHGSNDYYNCSPVNDAVMHNRGKNCLYIRTASTTGTCWKVHDGSYHCEMHWLAGPAARANTVADQPGPTTY